MLFLSFFSLPLSLEPACTLPSLLFLTWPEYPAIYLGLPSDSTRFALDQKKKKNGEISAPELGAWWDLGILFMSGVEWISVSWTKDTPVILGGKNSSVALCCRLLTGCLCGKRFGEDCERSICLSVPHRIISAASLFTPGPRENLKVPLVVSFSQHSQQLWNTKH